MKVLYALGAAIFLIGCSKSQNPNELFLASKEKMGNAAQVQFDQEIVWEDPNLAEFDTFVYSLDGDKKVTIRQLKIGASDGENTVITEGLAAGDRVVLEGTDRLKEGSEVEVVNDSNQVPTTPTEHLQGKSAAQTPDAAVTDKAKKGA